MRLKWSRIKYKNIGVLKYSLDRVEFNGYSNGRRRWLIPYEMVPSHQLLLARDNSGGRYEQY